uniref:Olfactory receptor n=1 Tax=Gopherus agassizii TaxID=38772 RepID=A0A452IAQ0_9SAUR
MSLPPQPSHNEMRKKMSNQTTLTEFLLLGFSDVRELQILHFVMFLVIYLVGLMGNLLIITAVVLDHHLHTPMYFFLLNLSILDFGSISVTIPKSMVNSLINTRVISYPGCVTQVFLFLLFVTTDLALLTIMAYDRYVAICQPLHYERVMNRRACVQMAASAWITGIVYSALHTGNTFRLPFCHEINHFFCDFTPVIKLSCSDTRPIELVTLVLASIFTLPPFLLTLISYVCIIITILRIPSTTGRQKAFSTCSSHLIVVTIFYGTLNIVYLSPKTPTLRDLNKVFSVFYTVLTPLVNPIIYSLRNKNVKEALAHVRSECVALTRDQRIHANF